MYSWQFFRDFGRWPPYKGWPLNRGRLIEVRLYVTNISFLLFSVFSLSLLPKLCEKRFDLIWFVYINNSLHLARKYARTFEREHSYLFRELNSFPRVKLEVNCELRRTDNVQGQISEHIFTLNGGYSSLFHKVRSFVNWGISLGYSPVLAEEYSVTWRVKGLCNNYLEGRGL